MNPALLYAPLLVEMDSFIGSEKEEEVEALDRFSLPSLYSRASDRYRDGSYSNIFSGGRGTVNWLVNISACHVEGVRGNRVLTTRSRVNR